MGIFNLFKPKKTLIEIDQLCIQDKMLFESQYKNPRVPVLLKGAAKDWPLFTKWSKDYITNNMGSYVCKIIQDSRPAYAKDQTTLKFYFDKLKNVSTLTLDPFIQNKPPLFYRDIKTPNPFFATKEIQRFFFFHSIKDAGTLPHNHGNAFNILQDGEKEWVFYDASQTHNINGYQTLIESNKEYPPGTHAKDWFRKEIPKLLKKVDKVFCCTQEAGDIVFIPKGYCHAVLNKSEVMGIVFETY